MKTKTRNKTVALAFATLAGVVGTAWAQDSTPQVQTETPAAPGAETPSGAPGIGQPGMGPMRRDGRGPEGRFSRLDADGNGTISLEEFADLMGGNMASADADGDGELTVAEIADAIERRRYERMAARMIERMDNDGDGRLMVDEVRSRQQKMFALMDRDDSGDVSRDEMRRHMAMMGHDGDRRGRHMDGRGKDRGMGHDRGWGRGDGRHGGHHGWGRMRMDDHDE